MGSKGKPIIRTANPYKMYCGGAICGSVKTCTVSQIARALCLAGAAAADVPAVETVFPAFRDDAGLKAYIARGRRDGFVGMMAIHPAQVAAINEGFTPSQDEVDFAERVIALFRDNPGAATLALDGKMLDRPHLVQAERLLARVRS